MGCLRLGAGRGEDFEFFNRVEELGKDAGNAARGL